MTKEELGKYMIHPELVAKIKSSGIEELPPLESFDCRECGNKWIQVFIEGATDV